MSRTSLTRRRFIQGTLGLLAYNLLPPGLAASPPGPPEYFVPLEAYHELPPDCYQPNLIRPLEIIVHWDGNRHGQDLWVAAITYETLKLLKQSAHFAVDAKRIWQMLPMYRRVIQESHGARGYNWAALNIEMAGINFDSPDSAPPESEVSLTVRLVSQLMDFYGIAFEHVVGHFERDPRGDKIDPGVVFMAGFRERLKAYRAGLSPVKQSRLEEP